MKSVLEYAAELALAPSRENAEAFTEPMFSIPNNPLVEGMIHNMRRTGLYDPNNPADPVVFAARAQEFIDSLSAVNPSES